MRRYHNPPWRRMLLQMYKLAVWDSRGNMYMPMYDYKGYIVAYGPAQAAISAWHNMWSIVE